MRVLGGARFYSPWSVDAAGAGRRFETPEESKSDLRRSQSEPPTPLAGNRLSEQKVEGAIPGGDLQITDEQL